MNYCLFLQNELVEVVVEVYYTAHYRPAFISGSPDSCHPDESELVLHDYVVSSVRHFCPLCGNEQPCACGTPITTFSREELDAAFTTEQEAIEERAWEEFHAARNDDKGA